MTTTDFHPDLRLARFLPHSVVGPRRLRLIRGLMLLQPTRRDTHAVVEQAGPGVSVRVFRPASVSGPRPGLLWIHGGGLIMGSAAGDDRKCRALADRLGAIVVSVDYRLAPEYPFPIPLEDCYTGLRWLAAHPDVDTDRIAIGGDSAGGGLSAALAILARDRGRIRPVLQLLAYPMLDDRSSDRTDIDPRRFRMWDQDSNRLGWRSYLGSSAATIPPLAVPARHEDLTGLPPAWIGVGTHDLFHDEDVAYARRLRAAGVDCELEIVPGAYHGFDHVEARTGVSRAFFRAQVTALRNAFGG
ncbi:alpha/beta hydrolase [Nocardia macrotermitis]|uniref:Carboxylesterase NlhH n=1 Tax=Nocardia macrotermitis TaxID=2585198 RepID=A0A7K0CUA7_9NOCA|nr:alpha/beta hydrolase [Nocardia macrotermitis]MQY17065.1 Carboxylesterase NlhH [Nocardia macrotermitis]